MAPPKPNRSIPPKPTSLLPPPPPSPPPVLSRGTLPALHAPNTVSAHEPSRTRHVSTPPLTGQEMYSSPPIRSRSVVATEADLDVAADKAMADATARTLDKVIATNIQESTKRITSGVIDLVNRELSTSMKQLTKEFEAAMRSSVTHQLKQQEQTLRALHREELKHGEEKLRRLEEGLTQLGDQLEQRERTFHLEQQRNADKFQILRTNNQEHIAALKEAHHRELRQQEKYFAARDEAHHRELREMEKYFAARDEANKHAVAASDRALTTLQQRLHTDTLCEECQQKPLHESHGRELEEARRSLNDEQVFPNLTLLTPLGIPVSYNSRFISSRYNSTN
jgi:hypothetical protein